jgi:hypothetical protein
MLLWIDIDPNLIRPDDEIKFTEEEEKAFGLRVTVAETEKSTLLYRPLVLSYANGNMWAMKQILNLPHRLNIWYVDCIFI